MVGLVTDVAPAISMIIPSCRRTDLVERLLPAWMGQEVEAPYEVIIVNNVPGDRTTTLVREAEKRYPNLRLVEESRPGAGRARHAGALVARAELLLFIDDDMEPERTVVREHLRMHAGRDALVCLGNVISAKSRHPFERMMAYVYDGPRGTLSQRAPTPSDCWSGHISMKREVYFQVGGFEDTFGALGGEDLDLGVRLFGTGIPIQFVSEALTHHHFTARFSSGLARAYRNGVAYGYIKTRHPGKPVIDVEPAAHPIRAQLLERACRAAAGLLEIIDRREGVPIGPLARVYEVGLRNAVSRGLADYSTGHAAPDSNGALAMDNVPSIDWNWQEAEIVPEWHEPLYAVLARLFSDVAAGAKVLEVGAGGSHTLCALAKRRGYRTYGLDPDPAGIATTRRMAKREGASVTMIRGDGHHLPFASEQFDVVYSLGLIEHFSPEKSQALLAEHARVCRRGGRVIVSVPNLFNVPHTLRKVIEGKRYPYYPERSYRPSHLAHTLANAGLRPIDADGMLPLWGLGMVRLGWPIVRALNRVGIPPLLEHLPSPLRAFLGYMTFAVGIKP